MQLKEKHLQDEVILWPDLGSTAASCDAIVGRHKEELMEFDNWAVKLRAFRRLQEDVKYMTAFAENETIPKQSDSAGINLRRLMDRIVASPYLESTLSPLMGKEASLLSSEGVASSIWQVGIFVVAATPIIFL